MLDMLLIGEHLLLIGEQRQKVPNLLLIGEHLLDMLLIGEHLLLIGEQRQKVLNLFLCRRLIRERPNAKVVVVVPTVSLLMQQVSMSGHSAFLFFIRCSVTVQRFFIFLLTVLLLFSVSVVYFSAFLFLLTDLLLFSVSFVF